ncbi:putative DNA-binding WGR domain protein [Bacillus cereus]|nr:putative DNA-binding WGR domain protein [Bacillus cereus]
MFYGKIGTAGSVKAKEFETKEEFEEVDIGVD